MDLNIVYKTYLSEQIKELIYIRDNNNKIIKKVVNLPKYGGTENQLMKLRKWICYDSRYKLKFISFN